MRKRLISYVMIAMIVICTMTGCVKYSATMKINKDKSMNYSIIYAFNTDVFGNEKILNKKEITKLKKNGFSLKKYSKDKMKGYVISKKINNIDNISQQKNKVYNLSNLLAVNDNILFKVKKGIFKNKYYASFVFDSTKSDLKAKVNDSNKENTSSDQKNIDDNNSNNDEDIDDNTYDEDNDELDDNDSDDFEDSDSSDEDELEEEEEDITTSVDDNIEDDDLTEEDYKKLLENVELDFKVILPYSSLNNNAFSKKNNNKILTWNLSNNKAQIIRFEFELYNKKVISWVIISSTILISGSIILIVLFNKKKHNKHIKM